MRIRHRVPTIFNIYMLDVICCSLGCVVLLWHVSYDEAEKQTAAAELARESYEQASRDVRSASTEVDKLTASLRSSHEKYKQIERDLADARRERGRWEQIAADRQDEIDKTRGALDRSSRDADKLRGEIASLEGTSRNTSGKLDKTRSDLDRARAELARSSKELDALRVDLARAESELEKTQGRLARANTDLSREAKAGAELRQQLTAADRRVTSLEKELAGEQNAADDTAKKLREQIALLERAESRNKKLEQQVSETRAGRDESQTRLNLSELRVRLLESELDRQKKELNDSGQRFKELLASHDGLSKQVVAGSRELTEARATIASLQGDNKKLEGEKVRLINRTQTLQLAADQRFAGIELRGQNVLFLIDMSGSMELIDSATEDPNKWPEVCETIARLMRSLVGLQRFQVILFSDRPRYLFGYEGQWLKYDSENSVRQTLAALKKIKPQGETNLHTVFSEAFRYRALGMDTIYVLSDGLPNAGEGLPAEGADKLSEAQKTETYSKNLRQRLREWNRPLPDQPRVHINTIGFFFESPDVGAFLWALAREHEGSFVGMSKP